MDDIGRLQDALGNTCGDMLRNGLDRRKSHYLAFAAADQAVISRVFRPNDLAKLYDLVKLVEPDMAVGIVILAARRSISKLSW